MTTSTRGRRSKDSTQTMTSCSNAEVEAACNAYEVQLLISNVEKAAVEYTEDLQGPAAKLVEAAPR